MKIFAIAGTLITVVIIGFLAATYFQTISTPVTSIPETQTPYGITGSPSSQTNVIDTAREIASMDRERQREMQNIIDRIEGANTTP